MLLTLRQVGNSRSYCLGLVFPLDVVISRRYRTFPEKRVKRIVFVDVPMVKRTLPFSCLSSVFKPPAPKSRSADLQLLIELPRFP